MLFPTYEFLSFFATIFILSIFLKRRVFTYKCFLLFASLVFYLCGFLFRTQPLGLFDSLKFIGLLVTDTAINYLILKKTANSKHKKVFLVLGLVINLIYLGFFKYHKFFSGSLEQNLIIERWSFLLTILNNIVPIGISFYTFRIIAHLVDCYWNQQECPTFVDYAVYVTYFPQIGSGPISRANEFYKQLNSREKYNYQIENVAILIISGLFKAYILSSLLDGFTREPFDSPKLYSSLDLILSTLAYSCLIYVNFSGYSDLANAISSLLGFKPIQNFKMPYSSQSLQEFWHRWHISLSEWLKDYLYIPLGGSKKGKLRKYFNLLLTMLIGGLWHGASWNFIIWGGFHGMGLIVNHLWKDVCKMIQPSLPENSFSKFAANCTQVFSVIFTFAFVTFCWIFFNTRDYDTAIQFIQGIFNLNSVISIVRFNVWQLYVIFFIVFLMNFAGEKISAYFCTFISRQHLLLQIILISILLYVIFRLGPNTPPDSIYLNF